MARSFTGPEEPQAKSGENLLFEFRDDPLELQEKVTPEIPDELPHKLGDSHPARFAHGRPDSLADERPDKLSDNFDDVRGTSGSSLGSSQGSSHDDKWEVGDSSAEFDAPGATASASPEPPPSEPAFTRRRKVIAPIDDADDIPDEPAFDMESGRLHSSGFIIGLILLVIVTFGVITMLICNAPSAGASILARLPVIGSSFVPPIEPARDIALRDVRMTYRNIKGNVPALIVSGNAENAGREPLHAIQLSVQLLDGMHRPLGTVAVFCGNSLATNMMGEMTPREIDFYQKLQPPKNFVLQPLEPAPFTVVFINPPATVNSVSLEVTQATAATADEVTQAATPN